MKKPAKTYKIKAKPADTFGEKIEYRPKRQKSAEADEREKPIFRPHDEFGEWLLRDN
jgi:hypothetical protein